MLDARTLALLNFINNSCEGSGYKIFSIEELVSALPVKLKPKDECLRECLTLLSEREFISIKYQDEREICLRPQVKGRASLESVKEGEKDLQRQRKSLFLTSFLGGLVGSFISGVITLAILLVLGRI